MKSKNITKRQLLTVTLVGSVVFYAIISLFISFLHNPHEDPTCFHDDCPACRWEKQSQEKPVDYYALLCSISIPGDCFAGLIDIENSYLPFQELFISYPSRSPPFYS